jgi:diguanylate cyclase (GGDEF)-like protein
MQTRSASAEETGDPLQRALQRLQESTGADMVLLGEVFDSPFRRVRSLCGRLDQAWQQGFSYLLETHPCQEVFFGRAFQHRADACEAFPQAFLLTDNRMRAYAGYPVSLDGNTPNGVLVLMSRSGWNDTDALRLQLAKLAEALCAGADSLADQIKRIRVLDAGSVRELFFREMVQDSPEGMAATEFMPPIPVNLPEEQLVQRMMHTGRIVECNEAMVRLYGYPDRAAMLGEPLINIHGAEKAPRMLAYWMRRNFDIRDVESQAVDAAGAITWAKGSAFGEIRDGKLLHGLTRRSDVSKQKRHEAAIAHKAHHDALTGLPNRYWMQERIDELGSDHAARGKRLCVGILDLNGFKEINDTLGHAVGDLVLQAVAVRLLKGLKPHGAELARLGGDEFALLMPELSAPQRAEEMAETVQELLAEPFLAEDMHLTIGGSLGLAMFPDRSDSAQNLLRFADVAMYAAKNANKPFLWYHPDINKHSRRRLSLLTSLGPAIENGELFLLFQPKIDVRNNRVSGFEALVRWQHPVHGVIPPNDFIPSAETSDVIRPLTRWVLEAAITQGSEWLRRGHALRMAINISARNLLEDNLEAFILDCLGRHAFPAGLLELEVTESALMTHPAQAMEFLLALRSHGISIAIDDFGTGYSSLAYLARLPVTTLKVDQGFVREMLNSRIDAQIVRSVIGLAHQCELSVVAEGVEDDATLQALLAMGCDLAQGYLIRRPMDAGAASAWLADSALLTEAGLAIG